MAPRKRNHVVKGGVAKESALQAQARRVIVNAATRDTDYVSEQLANNPSMASLIAELLRDGTLQRVLTGTPLTSAMLKDKQLPATLTRWKQAKGTLAKRILQCLANRDLFEHIAQNLADDDDTPTKCPTL